MTGRPVFQATLLLVIVIFCAFATFAQSQEQQFLQGESCVSYIFYFVLVKRMEGSVQFSPVLNLHEAQHRRTAVSFKDCTQFGGQSSCEVKGAAVFG